jgi:hypothetical protein
MSKFRDFKDEIIGAPRVEDREIFVGRCLYCKRKLRIVIINDATQWWAGNCKCGYRNIFTLTALGRWNQKIEKIKKGQ